MDEEEITSYSNIFSDEEIANIKSEFSRLEDVCYLDHIGSALYSRSYIQAVSKDLNSNIYSNPHSHNSTSRLCSDTIDQVRYRILRHFNTDVNEYSVVFTSGATGALNLIADAFLWKCEEPSSDEWYPKETKSGEDGGYFVYMEDNHTSVLGMRSVVERKGATVICLSHSATLEALCSGPPSPQPSTNEASSPQPSTNEASSPQPSTNEASSPQPSTNEVPSSNSKTNCAPSPQPKTNSMFVYSAQCNFSGVKYPLEWVKLVQDGALERNPMKPSKWYCVLDAASYVSTNELDLGKGPKPDFVCISFYKLFGYPTGLGCLLVRNSCANVLRKPYYGGGTVLISLSSSNRYVPRPCLHDRLEDGTLNFLSIVSLRHGFDTYFDLVGSMDKVSRHSFYLAQNLYNKLSALRHENGQPLAVIYADTKYDDIRTQGNIVNFNILRSNGEYVGYSEIMSMANMHRIQLRTGCFCNPGACRRHLGLSVEKLISHYQAGHVCGDNNDLVSGEPTGSVRVSFGVTNTLRDVDLLLGMLEEIYTGRTQLRHSRDHFSPINYIYSVYEKMVHTWEDCSDSPCPITPAESSTESYPVDQPYLSHIFLYPVKSCGRMAVNSWELDSTGLKYDRMWMVTNESGVVLTQKREHKLCLIRPKIDLKAGKLILTSRGFPALTLDLEGSGELVKVESKVCTDCVDGIDCGVIAGKWLDQVLGRSNLRLIRHNTRHTVLGSLSLSNQAQYLLINEDSIRWLRELINENPNCLKGSLLDRFRANFVVSGVGEPHIEQTWTSVTIGNVSFNVDGACNRCQMICLDQDTGDFSKEPLTTLTANLQGKLQFGIYLSRAEHESAAISVTDSVSFQ